MAANSKRPSKLMMNGPATDNIPKKNFWQKLLQIICCCGVQNSPTAENVCTEMILHDKQQGAAVYAKEKFESSDGQASDLQYQRPERSNGSLGIGFEKTKEKKPENLGNSGPDAKTNALSNLKPGHMLRNKPETSVASSAEKTEEHPVRNKINSPEQPVHRYSSQEDFIRDAINKHGKCKDPEPSKETNRSFEPQSVGLGKESLNQEKSSESQIKKVGSTEKQEDVVNQPSIRKSETRHIDPGPPKIPASFIRQLSYNGDNKYTGSSHPNTEKSGLEKEVVKLPSFNKDDRYKDTILPKKTMNSIPEKVVRQTGFKDNKYEDTGCPITTKSSVVPHVVKQTSFKDFADTRPPVTTKGDVAQDVLRQTNFKDDKYKDTCLPPITKSSFPQNIVKQPSDDKYMNNSLGQQVLRQASFSKDDKYTGINHPPKTSKSSVGHTIVEQQKGVPKQEKSNENQGNTRLSSSIFTNPSSLGQGGHLLPPKSIAKPEGINKDDKSTLINDTVIIKSIGQASNEQQIGAHKQDNTYEIHRDTRPDPTKSIINGSGQQAAVTLFSNQQKGVHKQGDTSTKDKFGFSYSFSQKD